MASFGRFDALGPSFPIPRPSFDRLDVGLRNGGSLLPIGSTGTSQTSRCRGSGRQNGLRRWICLVLQHRGRSRCADRWDTGVRVRVSVLSAGRPCGVGSLPGAVPGSRLPAGCLRWLVCGRLPSCFATWWWACRNRLRTGSWSRSISRWPRNRCYFGISAPFPETSFAKYGDEGAGHRWCW